MATPEYYTLHNYALDFLYNRFPTPRKASARVF
ncbi:hypothetical protein XM38_004770 [Halomicronema hongdechloris C2206]|uniref:Uncharacterized protein n=1 Tax=Halomicronema hongdechloris C2206 TaxID=1641165 RepID=A0A1Z3HH01_9CYAN|nr:hypothetical protein XM38_004770 [Halomicronema hongdechloris C2206]